LARKAATITFDEIQRGDRLRVTHVLGGHTAYFTDDGGVTRTVTAVAEVSALDKVWLNEGGHTVAHRGWKGMKIVRLTPSRSLLD